MNGALGALAAGDDRIALDDLYFLLGQYPADVNAQFLCRAGLLPAGPLSASDAVAAWCGLERCGQLCRRSGVVQKHSPRTSRTVGKQDTRIEAHRRRRRLLCGAGKNIVGRSVKVSPDVREPARGGLGSTRAREKPSACFAVDHKQQSPGNPRALKCRFREWLAPAVSSSCQAWAEFHLPAAASSACSRARCRDRARRSVVQRLRGCFSACPQRSRPIRRRC